MAFNIRIIIMSAGLCCIIACSQNEPQVFTPQLNQAPINDRQARGEAFSQAGAKDQSSLNFDSDTALAIFERRILPIFQSVKPSSCAECHLSGVDLKEYIRPTQQQTFASLVSAGLIDVAKTDDSKIRTSMGTPLFDSAILLAFGYPPPKKWYVPRIWTQTPCAAIPCGRRAGAKPTRPGGVGLRRGGKHG